MNYYQQGTRASVAIVPSRYRDSYRVAKLGASMARQGMMRGSRVSAYSIGTGGVEIGASRSDNALVDFMLSIAHIVLIGAGLWLLISAVASL